MQPIPEAIAWSMRAEAWAQGEDQAIEQSSSGTVSRWSDVAATGRPAVPADGVGWRTSTAEWRATTETGRWRQTTEWRSPTGTSGWRTTTEAWQAGDNPDAYPPPPPPGLAGAPHSRLPAISGTAWPTPDSAQATAPTSSTPSWQTSPEGAPSWQTPPETTPSWQSAADSTPSWRQKPDDAVPSWRQDARPDGRSDGRPEARQETWQGRPDATPSWQRPASETTPSWQSPADAAPGWQSPPDSTPGWQRPPVDPTPSWQSPPNPVSSRPADAAPSWQQRPPDEAPSWRRAPDPTPSWQSPPNPVSGFPRPGEGPAGGSFDGFARPADAPPSRPSDEGRRPSWDTRSTWQQTADSRSEAPSWRDQGGPQQPPSYGGGWTDDGRHYVREDDRAQWRRESAAGQAGLDAGSRSAGRRRAPEPGSRTSGGTGWSTRSDADNWAGHTDTGSIPAFQDPLSDTGSWRRDSADPADRWRREAPERDDRRRDPGEPPATDSWRMSTTTDGWQGTSGPATDSWRSGDQARGASQRSDRWRDESTSDSWRSGDQARGPAPAESWNDGGAWRRDPDPAPPVDPWAQSATETGVIPLPLQPRTPSEQDRRGDWAGRADTGRRSRPDRADTGSWQRDADTSDSGSWRRRELESGAPQGPEDTGSWRRRELEPGAPQGPDDTGSRRRRELESGAPQGPEDTGSWRRDAPRRDATPGDPTRRDVPPGDPARGDRMSRPGEDRTDPASWQREDDGRQGRQPDRRPQRPRGPESQREPRRGLDAQRGVGMPPRREPSREYARRREPDTSWQRELETANWDRDHESDVWLRDPDTGQWHRASADDDEDDEDDRGDPRPRRRRASGPPPNAPLAIEGAPQALAPSETDRRPTNPREPGRRTDDPRDTSTRGGDPRDTSTRGGNPRDTSTRGGDPRDTGTRGGDPRDTSTRGVGRRRAPDHPADRRPFELEAGPSARPEIRDAPRSGPPMSGAPTSGMSGGPIGDTDSPWDTEPPAPGGRPVSGIPGRPTSGLPNRPRSGMPNRPMSGIPDGPVSGVPDRPVSGLPGRPVSAMPDRPVSGMPGRRPISAMPQQEAPEGRPQEAPESRAQVAPGGRPQEDDSRPARGTARPDGAAQRDWRLDLGASPAAPASGQPGSWRPEAQSDAQTQSWRNQLRAEQGEPPLSQVDDAVTEIIRRPDGAPAWQPEAPTGWQADEPAAWLQAEREGAAKEGPGAAGYREGNTADWRTELNSESNLAEGESRRFGTSDFVPFRSPSAKEPAPVKVPAAAAAAPAGTTGLIPRTGPSWQDPPDTEWPPRGAVMTSPTGSYERRPVSTLTSASARQNDLLEPEEELAEDTGGPLAAVGYTVIWYGVPVVLFVAYMLIVNGSQQGQAVDTLIKAAPQFGLSLVLSVLVAIGLRWASGSWKAASVGLASAVVGGGLATVLTSAITGNSLS